MRVECPRCQALAEATIVELLSASVRFECEACQQTYSLEVASSLLVDSKPKASSNPSAELRHGGPSCPKCSAAVDDHASACRLCGLAVDRFASYRENESSEGSNLSAAWASLEDDWDNEELHTAFLEKASSLNDYRGAAMRYRAAGRDSARSKRVDEMLERIQRMAAAAMLSSKASARSQRQSSKKIVMVVVFLLLLVALAAVILLMLRNSEQTDSRQRSPSDMRKKRMQKSPAPTPRLPPPSAPGRTD